MRQAYPRPLRRLGERPLLENLEERRLLDAQPLDPSPLDPADIVAEDALLHNRTVALSDPVDGDYVTIKVTYDDPSGGGIVARSHGGTIEYITLDDSAKKVVIKVEKSETGDGKVNIGQIYGAFKKLDAKDVRFVGGQSTPFDGGIQATDAEKINIDSLGAAARLLVLDQAADGKQLKLTMQEADTTGDVEIQQPVKKLDVKGDFVTGTTEISAGATNVKIAGNLVSGNVDIDPNADNPDQQGKIRVQGDVEVDMMLIDQPLKSFITSGNIALASVLYFGAAMRSMAIAGTIFGSMTMLSTLGKGKVGGDIEGTVDLYRATKFSMAGALFGSLLATYQSTGNNDYAVKALTLGAMLDGSILHTLGHVNKLVILGAFINSQILFGVSTSWSLAGDGFPDNGAVGLLTTQAIIGSLILKGRDVDYAFFGGFLIGYGITKLQMGRLGAGMGGGIALNQDAADNTNVDVKEVGFQGPRLKGKGTDALSQLETDGGVQLSLLG